MSTQSSKHASSGFTLIELMVTVAIVTILATLAVTSYTSQVRKSRRTEAKSALLDLAGREERLFSTTNTYSQDEVFLGYATVSTQMTNMTFGNRYYTLTAVVPDPAQAPPPRPRWRGTVRRATQRAGRSPSTSSACRR
jgi:type IV pilus assembly protein PilE